MFNFDRFLFSLQYMWKGMLCIFVVIAVIIASIYLMNFIDHKLTARKAQKQAQEQQK